MIKVNLGNPSLLLTRPQSASEQFADAVYAHARFAQIVISPLIEIVAVKAPMQDCSATTFLFTSQHGALAAARRSEPAGRRAFCVGSRTTAVAQSLGYLAHEGGVDAEGLVTTLLNERPDGSLLHARGRHTRVNVTQRLASAQLDAREVVVYDQIARPLNAEAQALLAAPGLVMVPVFSPRSAELLAEEARHAVCRLRVAAISEAAAAPLSRLAHGQIEVAATPDAQGLIGAVNRLLASPSLA